MVTLQEAAAAAAAAAADDDDDDDDDDDNDDDAESQPSHHVVFQRNSSEGQSQDDADVDDVQPSIKTSVSEVQTVACVQTHASECQNETLDKECQTFCQPSQSSDDQRQTLEQEHQMLDQQCHDHVDQRSETLYEDRECQTFVLTTDKQCQVLDVQSEASDRKNVDERRLSVDREDHISVDMKGQECQYSSDNQLDSGQTGLETMDAQCQTAHDECQLSSVQVQTEDETSTTPAAATYISANETGVNDVHQQQQTTTPGRPDTEHVKVTSYIIGDDSPELFGGQRRICHISNEAQSDDVILT